MLLDVKWRRALMVDRAALVSAINRPTLRRRTARSDISESAVKTVLGTLWRTRLGYRTSRAAVGVHVRVVQEGVAPLLVSISVCVCLGSKPQPALGEIQEGTLALQVGGGVKGATGGSEWQR